MRVMSPQEFHNRMLEIANDQSGDAGDAEDRHGKADDLLCELLKSLGYEDGVKVFDEMEKWYA